MRIWWLVLVLTVSSVVTLLFAPPTTDDGIACLDPTAWILLTPDYTEFEGGGLDPETGPSPCAQAARGQGAFAAGLGLVGGAATWVTHRIGLRRRSGAAHSDAGSTAARLSGPRSS